MSQKNEKFLKNKLKTQPIINWSNEAPYEVKINGIYKEFPNSYKAHIAKHPKNQNEEYVWNSLLENFPDNIELSYLGTSLNIITNPQNILRTHYDKKNHSLNIDVPVKELVNEEDKEKYEREFIRVGLKRSRNLSKIVIATCHPRYLKSQNNSRIINPDALNYFKYKRINPDNYDSAINYLFCAPQSMEFKEQINRLDTVLKNYMKVACKTIENLEYYKRKNKAIELTDMFNYDKITEQIDNIFLYKRFIEMKYDNVEFETNDNPINNLIDRYKKIDKYKHVNDYITEYYFKELTGFKSLDEKLKHPDAHSVKKSIFIEEWSKLKKTYKIDLKALKNKPYASKIKTKESDATSIKEPEIFQSYELFAIAVHFKLKYDDFNDLLNNISKSLHDPYIKEEFNLDIEKDWDKLIGDDKNTKFINDIIKRHNIINDATINTRINNFDELITKIQDYIYAFEKTKNTLIKEKKNQKNKK